MRDDAKSSWQVRLPVSLLAMTLFCLTACDAVEQPDVSRDTPSVQVPPEPNITLNSVEVLRVRLDKELVRPDASGKDRVWAEAYMVQLGITLPKAMGPAFEIYLDGDRVPEYGGWKGGIYFWVYDPEELAVLDGLTVSYRFARSQRFEIGTLTLGDPGGFRRVSERELFKR